MKGQHRKEHLLDHSHSNRTGLAQKPFTARISEAEAIAVALYKPRARHQPSPITLRRFSWEQ